MFFIRKRKITQITVFFSHKVLIFFAQVFNETLKLKINLQLSVYLFYEEIKRTKKRAKNEIFLKKMHYKHSFHKVKKKKILFYDIIHFFLIGFLFLYNIKFVQNVYLTISSKV